MGTGRLVECLSLGVIVVTKLAVVNVVLVASSYLLVSRFQQVYPGYLTMLASVVFIVWASKPSNSRELLRFAFVLVVLSIPLFFQDNLVIGSYLLVYGAAPYIWHTVLVEIFRNGQSGE